MADRRRNMCMGEAKTGWMRDVVADPGRYPDDFRMLTRGYLPPLTLEPNPHFRDSIEFALLSPYIERWAAAHGMGIVRI